MTNSISAELWEEFRKLVLASEPDAVWMDGEATQEEAEAKLREIAQQWKELEMQVGRKVTEDEIIDLLFAH
mgnify:CR=1 FL=1